jgi:hypothetical protein
VLPPLGGEPAQLLQATGEAVARALELLEAEQARGVDPGGFGARRRDEGKGLGDDRRELALELSDLRPQRVSRRTLTVASDGPVAEVVEGAARSYPPG